MFRLVHALVLFVAISLALGISAQNCGPSGAKQVSVVDCQFALKKFHQVDLNHTNWVVEKTSSSSQTCGSCCITLRDTTPKSAFRVPLQDAQRAIQELAVKCKSNTGTYWYNYIKGSDKNQKTLSITYGTDAVCENTS